MMKYTGERPQSIHYLLFLLFNRKGLVLCAILIYRPTGRISSDWLDCILRDVHCQEIFPAFFETKEFENYLSGI
jgi:hypothetical protein